MRSCPHAARMSRPRGLRTGEAKPASITTLAKRSIAVLLLVSKGLPGQGLNGMRFTLAGMPAIRRTSSRASAWLSLTPFSMTYSKVMRRALEAPGIAAAGGDQLGDRVFAVQRDQFVAQVVAHGMEGDGEVDAELGAGAVHHGDDTGGGQRDAAAGEGDALVVHRDGHRLGHVGVVVERLAHAHQDDGGEQAWAFPHGAGPFVVRVACRHELADDLRRAEIAGQALRAGVAEAAGEGAADLGGDADGASVFLAVGDVDGLGLLSVAEAEQEFAGVVLAGLHDGGFGAGDDEVFRQLLLQRAGDGGHAGEVGLAAVVDPVPELLGAEWCLAEGCHLLGQFRAREADEVAAAVGELHRRRIE